MNSINSNFIMIDHDFIDKSGKKYSGFVGVFQRADQTELTTIQKMFFEDAIREGKLTCFGSVDEVVKVLNENR